MRASDREPGARLRDDSLQRVRSVSASRLKQNSIKKSSGLAWQLRNRANASSEAAESISGTFYGGPVHLIRFMKVGSIWSLVDIDVADISRPSE